jgi:SAM-dependent methyltransferase
MQYDPIKRKVGYLFGKTPLARRVFYRLLDILLLRSWHVRKELKRVARTLPQGAEILDAGAGFGQYTWRMASMNKTWKISAIDLKEEQVADCNRFFTQTGLSDRVLYSTGDLTSFYGPPRYNLILSVDVMEHIEDDNTVFRIFLDTLKPGGTLLISTPSDQGGSDVHDSSDSSFIDEHVRDGYNIDALTATLREIGFTSVSAAYTYGIPGSIAWRLTMKYPVKLLNLSALFWVILPFYYIVVMPFALVLNLLDLNIKHKSGTGLIVKAVK